MLLYGATSMITSMDVRALESPGALRMGWRTATTIADVPDAWETLGTQRTADNVYEEAFGRARSSPDAAARGAAPSGGWTGPSFEPDLDQDPRSGGGHTQTHDDDLDGGVPLSERMAPPPFPELLGWTRHCFQLYWGVTDDYPATACEGPPITAHAGPLLPTGADLAAVRVVEQSDLWETPHPCPTEHLSPSDPRRGPMLDLVHAACCLLWKHQDIVRWACCFPRYWSPQWSSDAPWAWQDLNPTLTSSPPGEPWDRDRVDPDGYGGWSDRGPPDLGGALVGYLDRGALDVILVDYFRQAEGKDLDPQSRAPMGDCEKDGAAGGAVNLIEAFDAPFERAVVLPLGSSSWVAWLDLWSNATTDSERGCAALRAASTILHELVHSEAMDWSHHLYNHCLDPCVMVQSAWYYGMALRFPELRSASCCNGITQPMHFMDTVKRGQPCY